MDQDASSPAFSSAPSSPLSDPPASEYEPKNSSPARHTSSAPATTPDGSAAAPEHSDPKCNDPKHVASDHEEHPDGNPPAKRQRTARKAQPKGYPADIPRLTRFGKGTYAVGHGPLPDDIDWTEISTPVIKEQLFMRGVSKDGKRKTWAAASEEQLGLTHKSAFEVGDDIATKKRPGGYRQGANEKTHASAKKALEQRMILVKRRDDSAWDDYSNSGASSAKEANFYILSSSKTYCITINDSPKCDCPSKTYNPQNHCKHIIYVLLHILRAPEALIHQNRFLEDEVRSLLTCGPNLRPSKEQIDNDPTMKDGIPKDKAAHDCPICYQALGNEASVTCATCGRHAHQSCHKTWENENSGWGPLTCVACQSVWQ